VKKKYENPLLAKRKSVYGKDHELVRGIFDRSANATHDIFENMQQEKPITGGRM
jgi:hypothetical protein